MTDWTEIEQARTKAHAKHGANSIEGIDAADTRWLGILGEEAGEASEAALLAWNALLQAKVGRVAHEQTYDATGSLRAELVDVLAVASAWLDALDPNPAPVIQVTRPTLALVEIQALPVGSIVEDRDGDRYTRTTPWPSEPVFAWLSSDGPRWTAGQIDCYQPVKLVSTP